LFFIRIKSVADFDLVLQLNQLTVTDSRYNFFSQQNLILIQNGVIITVKKNLRRRTVWTVVIVEVEVHITMDTDLEAISGVCRCAVFKQ